MFSGGLQTICSVSKETKTSIYDTKINTEGKCFCWKLSNNTVSVKLGLRVESGENDMPHNLVLVYNMYEDCRAQKKKKQNNNNNKKKKKTVRKRPRPGGDVSLEEMYVVAARELTIWNRKEKARKARNISLEQDGELAT